MLKIDGAESAAGSLDISEHSRVLALDWGEKRVGLAISDPFGITAQGLPTMSRRNKQQDFSYLKSLVQKHSVSVILIGNPLQMNGQEGTQAGKIHVVAKEIEHHLEIPVRLWDERLTSVEARRLMQDFGVSSRKKGKAVDRMAAVLLLQNFLDSLPRPASLNAEAAP